MSAATFSPPPPYYKLYADFNDDPSSAPLAPPLVVGTYVQYRGNCTREFEVIHMYIVYALGSISSLPDYKRELRALNRELVLQFLELIDALIKRPSQSARCVEDMILLLRNIHHLLNSLKPHQARATVIHLLEIQLVKRREALAEICRKRTKARAMLQVYAATL